MANQIALTHELKKKIEIVILASYNKSKEKNFQDFNYVFPKNESVISYLKGKIKIFYNLDEYSRTFLVIHTRAKVALREFNEQKFEGGYLELLRQIFTLPEDINSPRLKSVKVEDKIEEDITSQVIATTYSTGNTSIHTAANYKAKKRLSRVKLIKENITGKKIMKQKQEKEVMLSDLEEINLLDFEDEEFSQANDLDDIDL